MGELRTITAVYRRGNLFPIVIVLLFGEGAWLLHLSKKQGEAFHFGDAWVWTAIVALVILMFTGGAILGGTHPSTRTCWRPPPTDRSPGGAHRDLHAQTWATSHMNTFLAIAVVFNMVTKPSGDATAIMVLVIGMAVGA